MDAVSFVASSDLSFATVEALIKPVWAGARCSSSSDTLTVELGDESRLYLRVDPHVLREDPELASLLLIQSRDEGVIDPAGYSIDYRDERDGWRLLRLLASAIPLSATNNLGVVAAGSELLKFDPIDPVWMTLT